MADFKHFYAKINEQSYEFIKNYLYDCTITQAKIFKFAALDLFSIIFNNQFDQYIAELSSYDWMRDCIKINDDRRISFIENALSFDGAKRFDFYINKQLFTLLNEIQYLHPMKFNRKTLFISLLKLAHIYGDKINEYAQNSPFDAYYISLRIFLPKRTWRRVLNYDPYATTMIETAALAHMRSGYEAVNMDSGLVDDELEYKHVTMPKRDLHMLNVLGYKTEDFYLDRNETLSRSLHWFMEKIRDKK